jgi:hypothetical protein
MGLIYFNIYIYIYIYKEIKIARTIFLLLLWKIVLLSTKVELIEASREGEREMASGEVVERAECGHCGTREESAMEYAGWFQERFGGCGLCEEAIKDEQAKAWSRS